MLAVRAALRNRTIPPADRKNNQRLRLCILTADRRHVNATTASTFGGEHSKDLDSEHLLLVVCAPPSWPFGRAAVARWPTLPRPSALLTPALSGLKSTQFLN